MPGLPGLEKSFYVFLSLLRKYMPRLFHHCNEIGFTPLMYASKWFMTLFNEFFPIHISVRILDIYLMEGRKILYRIALAIFKLLERDLMGAQDLETPLTLMKTWPDTCNLDDLIHTAHKFTFSRKLIYQLER